MKKLSMLVLASLFAMSACFAFGAASARASDNDRYRTVDYRQLFTLMTEFGYEVNMRSGDDDISILPFSDEDFIWWIIGDKNRPRIDITDNGQRIEFYVYNKSNNSNLSKRSDTWNNDNVHGRARVDVDGDPILEHVLDISGGATEAAIRAFFKQCEESHKSWRAAVVD